MAKYIISGGATGIGAAIKHQLRARGDTVIIIDLKDGDYLVDLGDPSARQDVFTLCHYII